MTRILTGRLLGVAAALAAVAGSGCETMHSNTAKGAGVGGLLGAGIGTAIGAATGDAGTGALAGGLIGAGVGGIAGADADARDRERADAVKIAQAEATIASQPVRGPLSLDDVVQMSRPNPATGARMSDDLLIDYIRSTNSTFHLSPGDITYLTTNGVSDRVVREMVNARGNGNGRVAIQSRPRTVIVREEAPPPVVVYERPYWGPRPVFVHHHCPPPPIGFGVHIRR